MSKIEIQPIRLEVNDFDVDPNMEPRALYADELPQVVRDRVHDKYWVDEHKARRREKLSKRSISLATRVGPVLVTTAALVTAVNVFQGDNEYEPSSDAVEGTYTVESGDTSWGIANELVAENRNDKDIRPLVYDIEEATKQDNTPGVLGVGDTISYYQEPDGAIHIKMPWDVQDVPIVSGQPPEIE